MSVCAPHVGGTKAISCFSLDSLQKIADANDINYTENDSKEKLWNAINDKMSKICKYADERCWLKNSNIDINDPHIKPLGPKGKKQWLSNIDIAKVMKQFEKKHKDFMFIGPVPSDFDKIITEISHMDIEQAYKKGIRKIGIICNTDPHHKAGRHWLAMFIDLQNDTIEYFDSVGTKPFKSAEEFINNTITNAFARLGKTLEKKINKRQHQKADTECGVYSINYIVARLNGKSFEDITNKIIKDSDMNKCRKFYFSLSGE